jgi:hypothetical protein
MTAGGAETDDPARSPQAGRSSRSIQPSSRAVLPLGLLGAIAIVLVAEGYVARRKADLTSIFAIEWRANARAIRRHAAGSSVLCFGTSVTHMGVSPRVLEEAIRMPAYNFAISGAQPFACYVALRDALASGARPRAVTVDFMWSTLGQPHTFNELGLPEMASLLDCAEFALSARDASCFGRMALAWFLPTYRGRAEVRANIAAAVLGAEPNRNPERFLHARNASINRGAYHLGAVDYDGKVDPSNPVLFSPAWACPSASEASIRKFLDLAASRGIPVFWIMPPMAPAARGAWAASGVEAKYRGLVDSIAAGYANVTVVDATGADYPSSTFNDPVHLNRDGAVAFTADLARAIAARLAADGGPSPWRVRLPDYRPDTDAGRVEDSRTTLARIKGAIEAARR